MLEDAQQRVDRLPLLGAEERHQLLVEWNETQVPYPKERCLHELFESQVERTPEATALLYEDERLSYRELNERANRLAHYLRARGVGAERLVGICVERSVEMVVGLLGILKAGGAYVPLDPTYPAARLEEMLRDAQPAVIVTQSAWRHLFTAERTSAAGTAVVAIDGQWSEIGAAPSGNLPVGQVGVGPGSLMYVLYTSGSTGTPKGAMNEHGALVNRLCWMQEEYQLSAQDVVLQKTPLSFDVSGWEVFWPLLNGACMVLAKPGLHRDPRYLSELIAAEGVSVVHFVPSMLQSFLDIADRELCKTLRIVVCSGEELSVALQERCLRELQSAELHNLYGPTEAAIDVTYWACRAGTALRRVPIGRPIWNTQMYLLDRYMEPVPIGVAGEIYIGGAGVARGYLNRAQLTAERFIEDPFRAGGRLYRTGDLGRYLADGNIEFLGRNDHQVKIRGFRIELGEIETQLCAHAAVKEAVVLARASGSAAEKRLVAYVTSAGERLSVEELRSHLQGRLPEYMVPAAYVQLESLPLTANGKLDRGALPEPDAGAVVKREYAAPQGAVEQELSRLWEELLGVQRVGREDNFFELGGHSLLAMQLVSRLRAARGVEVGLREVFGQSTLQGLARIVERSEVQRQLPIGVVDRGQPLPLSLAQQRLWFLTQLEGASAAYHMAGGVRLYGELDRGVLRAALDAVIERHEVLRTRIVAREGQAWQQIGAGSGFALREVDLAEGSAQQIAEQVRRQSQEEVQEGFDLEHGPLIRGRLLRVGEEEHVLLVTMHHIVSDGWSMGVLINEVCALYGAYREGRGSPLSRLPIQYADYAVWQRRWLAGERLESQGRYWQEALRGAPALLELPTDHARPAVQSYAGGSVRVQLPEQRVRQLKEFSQRRGLTLFMTLLGSWASVLSRLSGQEEVVIGTPVANRNRVEVEGLIGFFVNTQALRIEVREGATVEQMLAGVKSRAVAAQEHQDIPFEQVVEWVKPVRSLAHSPIFQALFAWQNAPQGQLQVAGLQIETVQPPHGTAQFDLSLSLEEQGERIVGYVEYASALYEEATVTRYVQCWQSLLGGMLEDAQQRVDRLPLLGAEERQRLLVEWNETQVPYPQERCLHELFESQVERTPEATALLYEDERLSYRERTGWRIICARAAWGRSGWWGFASSAAWRWWSDYWGS
jgi:amino acid adenylation domain-containing protein